MFVSVDIFTEIANLIFKKRIYYKLANYFANTVKTFYIGLFVRKGHVARRDDEYWLTLKKLNVQVIEEQTRTIQQLRDGGARMARMG